MVVVRGDEYSAPSARGPKLIKEHNVLQTDTLYSKQFSFLRVNEKPVVVYKIAYMLRGNGYVCPTRSDVLRLTPRSCCAYGQKDHHFLESILSLLLSVVK